MYICVSSHYSSTIEPRCKPSEQCPKIPEKQGYKTYFDVYFWSHFLLVDIVVPIQKVPRCKVGSPQ